MAKFNTIYLSDGTKVHYWDENTKDHIVCRPGEVFSLSLTGLKIVTDIEIKSVDLDYEKWRKKHVK